MNIPILPSKTMDRVVAEGNLEERKTIRMPKDFRKFAEYEIGDFVYARTKEGNLSVLTVSGAYKEDIENDSLSAYVTSEIFSLIMGSETQGYDVELVEGITLGCDPEILLVDSAGNIIPAAKYVRKAGPIGYDGLMMEFRPLPSINAEDVARNILGLIEQARGFITDKDVRMIAVSSYHANALITPKFSQPVKLTTGFHLHYGLPKALLGYPKRFVADQIIKVLDYYVGIPAIVPEGSSDSYRRSVPYIQYGKPGGYRIDDRTLEYRVPGGILMRHPTWARGLIALGAAVIEDLVSRMKHCSEDFTDLSEVSRDEIMRLLYPNLPPMMDIFGTICSPTADRAKGYLEYIKSDIEKMVSYPGRAKAIAEFFDNLEIAYAPDIETNWWRYYNGQRQPKQMGISSTSF